MTYLSLARVSLIEDKMRNTKELCHVHHTSKKKISLNIDMSVYN